MFLSRLNEINGGVEKILPVSGSFWSNLKFFRMMDFTRNVSFRISLRWLIHIMNSVDKTKLSFLHTSNSCQIANTVIATWPLF